MKVLSLILITFISLIGLKLTDNVLSPKMERNIKRGLKSVWKTEDLELESVDFETINGYNKVFKVKEDEIVIGYLQVRRAKGCEIGGCSKKTLGKNNSLVRNYENFDYIIIHDINYVIKYVKVVNYKSDYGYEIVSKRWLKQYVGTKGIKLKYGHDIQAISGATVSGNSITDDISIASELLQIIEK